MPLKLQTDTATDPYLPLRKVNAMGAKDWKPEEPMPSDSDWEEIRKSTPVNHLLPDETSSERTDFEEPIPQFSAPTQHLIPDEVPEEKADAKGE